MKFMIDKASLRADDVKPCEGAIKLKDGGYGIKLQSLEELLELANKENYPIIIYPGNRPEDDDGNCPSYAWPNCKELPLLQIYDDYIE